MRGIQATADFPVVGPERETQENHMKVKDMELSILGSKWRVTSRDRQNDKLLEGLAGYTDAYARLIVLAVMDPEEHTISNPHAELQSTLRHEIIHAFFYESGLWTDSETADHWAMNEEMVDWLAIQFPKMFDVMQAAKALPWCRLELENNDKPL